MPFDFSRMCTWDYVAFVRSYISRTQLVECTLRGGDIPLFSEIELMSFRYQTIDRSHKDGFFLLCSNTPKVVNSHKHYDYLSILYSKYHFFLLKKQAATNFLDCNKIWLLYLSHFQNHASLLIVNVLHKFFLNKYWIIWLFRNYWILLQSKGKRIAYIWAWICMVL